MDASSVDERPPEVIDFRIRRAGQPRQNQIGVSIILASILFDSTAFYSLQYNLVDTLKSNETFHWSSENNSTASQIFYWINFISMIIFSVLSDAKLNRAKTIIIGFPLCLIGFILFTLGTNESFMCSNNTLTYRNESSLVQEKCAPVILTSLILIAIGDGAIRPNLIAFGADQIERLQRTWRYVDKFVIMMTAAAIFQALAKLFILQNEDYFTFYLFATSTLIVGALLFFIGWRYYRHVQPYDSVLIDCIPVYRNAFKKWRESRKDEHFIQRHRHAGTADHLHNSDQFNYEEGQDSMRLDERPHRFLDFAKVIHHGQFQDRIVDDVKSFQNALIISILVLPYWIIFSQLFTTFPTQAQYMSVSDSYSRFTAINLMFIIEHTVIIIGIFVLNTLVYRFLDARNRSLTIAHKFVIAMCFGFLTMSIAGGVEKWRQENCPRNQRISTLTIYAQSAQYMSVAFVQLFGFLSSFEFACLVAPRSARSLFISLSLVGKGIATAVVLAYMSYLAKTSSRIEFSCQSSVFWRPYTYFYILAGLQIIFMIIFLICQKYYRMIKSKQQQRRRNECY